MSNYSLNRKKTDQTLAGSPNTANLKEKQIN
jgi:hypothetical protein